MIQKKKPDFSSDHDLEEWKRAKKENKNLKKTVRELVAEKRILQTAHEILKKRHNQKLYASQKRRSKSKGQS